MDKIEPLVFTERSVSVGLGHLVKKVRHLGDIGFAHAPLDLDMMHCPVTLTGRGPVAESR